MKVIETLTYSISCFIYYFYILLNLFRHFIFPSIYNFFFFCVHNWSFSVGRVEYQTRPGGTGVSSFKHLLAKLPPRVHSVYYRDGIGNISSSHLRTDSRKVIYVFGTLKRTIFLPSFDIIMHHFFSFSPSFFCKTWGEEH